MREEKLRMLKTMNDKDAELQKEKKKRKVYQRKQKELEKKYKELEARAANLVPAGMGVPLPPGAKYVIIAADGTQGFYFLCLLLLSLTLFCSPETVAAGTPGATLVDASGKAIEFSAAAGGAAAAGGGGGPPPPPPPPGGGECWVFVIVLYVVLALKFL